MNNLKITNNPSNSSQFKTACIIGYLLMVSLPSCAAQEDAFEANCSPAIYQPDIKPCVSADTDGTTWTEPIMSDERLPPHTIPPLPVQFDLPTSKQSLSRTVLDPQAPTLVEPDYQALLTEYGYTLTTAGLTEDGYRIMKQAVSGVWHKESELRQLALCHKRLGDVLIEKAFEYKNAGRGTIGMKILNNAGIEYRRSIQLDPADAEACRAYVKTAREAVAIRPTFDNLLALASGYLLIGDYERSQMTYLRCGEVDTSRIELNQIPFVFAQTVACSSRPAPKAIVARCANTVADMISRNQKRSRLWYILGRLQEDLGDRVTSRKSYAEASSINEHIDTDLSSACNGAKPPIRLNNKEEEGLYLQEIEERVKQHWHPPVQPGSDNVVMLFKVHRNGTISDTRIKTDSGKDAFDQAARDAVKNLTAPYMPPGLPDQLDLQFTFECKSYPQRYY